MENCIVIDLACRKGKEILAGLRSLDYQGKASASAIEGVLMTFHRLVRSQEV